jgi:predicted amidophosphoribosyltransferase
LTFKDWLAAIFVGIFIAHILLSLRKSGRNRRGLCAKCQTEISPETAIGVTGSGQTLYYCSSCGQRTKRIDRIFFGVFLSIAFAIVLAWIALVNL